MNVNNSHGLCCFMVSDHQGCVLSWSMPCYFMVLAPAGLPAVECVNMSKSTCLRNLFAAAKLDTKIYRQMTLKMAVSEIL